METALVLFLIAFMFTLYIHKPWPAGNGASTLRSTTQCLEPNRRDKRPSWARKTNDDVFRCRQCKLLVGSVPYGGRHRNHCPYCLYSRHVDARRPGDRASTCGALMQPVGMFTRSNGEYALVHRCLNCGCARHNRIAADDDFDLVLALPDMTMPPAWETDEEAAARAS